MPVGFLRRLIGNERTQSANRQLGLSLAFVAGAVNAGGFMVVGSYTSHMTGIVSMMADAMALGHIGIVLTGLGSVLAFILGAGTSAMLVNWGRRQHLQSEYALPLLLEASLLLVFGMVGARIDTWRWLTVPATVLLLCYVMGLQNALITKVSRSEIRTTHITGIVTDLGIELGKWVYWNRTDGARVVANRDKIWLLTAMTLMFFGGGVVGALSFSHLGFVSTIPLAIVLLLLAIVPVWDDVIHHMRM